ncbi:hypothetical protein FACS1894184_17850 [Clostridia bacterium]|nr:hypothetical protein FACS1894184_17850 [Clostridia bacterium]
MPLGNKMGTGTNTTVAGSGVRVRLTASTSSSNNVLYTISQGVSVKLLEEAQSENYYWYKCKNNADTSKPDGYIRSDLLTNNNTDSGNGNGGDSGSGTTALFTKALVAVNNVPVLDEPGSSTAFGRIDLGRRIIVQDYNTSYYRTFWGRNPEIPAFILKSHVSLQGTESSLKSRVLWLLPHYVDKAAWYFGGNLTTQSNGLAGDWCMSFCNWIYTSAGGSTATSPLSQSNAKTARDWFVSSGRYVTNTFASTGSQTPLPESGQIVFYRWSNAPANITVSHAGLVYNVTGTTFTTYEGNRGNSGTVSNFTGYLSDSQVLGFGRPW